MSQHIFPKQPAVAHSQQCAKMRLSKEDWVRFYRIAFLVSRSRGETVEASQENAHDALIQFSTIDPSRVGNTEAYLRRIVINVINDKLRNTFRDRTISLDYYEIGEISKESKLERDSLDLAVIAYELNKFFSQTSRHIELFRFIFNKFVLYRPALNNILKKDNSETIHKMRVNNPQLKFWNSPRQLSAQLRDFCKFLEINSIDLQSVVELLQNSNFVLSNSNLASMAASVCEDFIKQIIHTVQHLRVGLILRSEANTHNAKFHMQQIFWQISQLVYNLSSIDQIYYIIGSLQYLRKLLQIRLPAKHIADACVITDAWQLIVSCFENNIFVHPAEEWVAIELSGLLPEYIDVTVDLFDQHIQSILAKVRNQRSLPKLGAAWACANISKLPKFSQLGQAALQSADLYSWPGGAAAHPMILVTPHLSHSVSYLQRTLHNSHMWEALFRALSNPSDVAKLGAICVLTHVPPICCPESVRTELSSYLVKLHKTSNQILKQKSLLISSDYFSEDSMIVASV